MNNHNIGLLGGGLEQAALANHLEEDTGWEVYAIFLEGPLLSPRVHAARDFRDVLWLCGTLVLPDPVCQEGLWLNAPLWQGPPVDAGQFLGSIGKGVLLLAGEMTPEFSRAAAAKELAVTPLFPQNCPGPVCGEDYRDAVLAALERASDRRVRPRRVDL